VEESAPTQTEEETTSGLCAGNVAALATPRRSRPVGGINGDIDRLLGMDEQP
jgi:hypothetical protein